MIKTAIGIISYNDLHYLKETLPDIYELSKNSDTKIFILDNAENDEIKEYIEKKYTEIEFLRHPDGNTGFGKGHNYLIKKSAPSKYYFCLNSDIKLNNKVFKECIDELNKDQDLFMVSAKLHHWDFKNNKKTDLIDSVGIVGFPNHSFTEWHHGEKDTGEHSGKKLFGVSGAAFIVRRSMIRKIHGKDDYLFDENMFMYKEDVDLSYRMNWLGLKFRMVYKVLGHHDRTVSIRKKKSLLERKMSYKNHLIMLFNNYSKDFSFKTKKAIIWYEIKKFFYYLFTAPKVAFLLFDVLRMKRLKKINKSKKRVKPLEIEKLLN